jgi:hypothetical protein
MTGTRSRSENPCFGVYSGTSLTISTIVFVFVLLSLWCSIVRADTMERAGDIGMLVLPATAASMALAYHDDPGIMQFGKSLAATGIVTSVLKFGFDEERPDGGDYSFPSMHSAVSFNAAGFIHERYGWRWSVPMYAAASFVCWSRVESRRHYTHDVLAGAAIGILGSRLFTKPRPDERTTIGYNGTRIVLTIRCN